MESKHQTLASEPLPTELIPPTVTRARRNFTAAKCKLSKAFTVKKTAFLWMTKMDDQASLSSPWKFVCQTLVYMHFVVISGASVRERGGEKDRKREMRMSVVLSNGFGSAIVWWVSHTAACHTKDQQTCTPPHILLRSFPSSFQLLHFLSSSSCWVVLLTTKSHLSVSSGHSREGGVRVIRVSRWINI